MSLVLVAVLGPLLTAAAHPARPVRDPGDPAAPIVTAPVEVAPPPPDPRSVRANEPGLWLSWAVLDRTDATVTGTPDRATARTNAESSIKAWLAADRLRVDAEAKRPLSAADRTRIDRAVRASDDDAAESLYQGLGGDAALRDLNAVCGVSVRTDRAGWWSYTQVTAQDAVRTLACVLDKAPTYPDGPVLVDALHGVDPDGAFGIPEALPSGTSVAVKNGWTAHSGTGLWNVDCVAAWDDRVMAVMTRYPIERGLAYGAGVCRDVTTAYLAHGT